MEVLRISSFSDFVNCFWPLSRSCANPTTFKTEKNRNCSLSAGLLTQNLAPFLAFVMTSSKGVTYWFLAITVFIWLFQTYCLLVVFNEFVKFSSFIEMGNFLF